MSTALFQTVAWESLPIATHLSMFPMRIRTDLTSWPNILTVHYSHEGHEKGYFCLTNWRGSRLLCFLQLSCIPCDRESRGADDSFHIPLPSALVSLLFAFTMAVAAAEKLSGLSVSGDDDGWAAAVPNLQKNLAVLSPEQVSNALGLFKTIIERKDKIVVVLDWVQFIRHFGFGSSWKILIFARRKLEIVLLVLLAASGSLCRLKCFFFLKKKEVETYFDLPTLLFC